MHTLHRDADPTRVLEVPHSGGRMLISMQDLKMLLSRRLRQGIARPENSPRERGKFLRKFLKTKSLKRIP